jgi:hypothetical protein
MSDQDLNQSGDNDELEQDEPVIQEDELASLKKRADLMGIKYHPAIGVDKLKEKILEALSGDNKTPEKSEVLVQAEIVKDVATDTQDNPVIPANIKVVENSDTGEVVYSLEETPGQKRKRLRNWATEKIRVRVTCMNPNKKEWQGEIFTVGNGAVGTLKEFIPFNTPDGWHVSRMILETMQARQCQIFVNKKTQGGITVREGVLIKEFAIELLDPLTPTEISELARRQAMANGKE